MARRRRALFQDAIIARAFERIGKLMRLIRRVPPEANAQARFGGAPHTFSTLSGSLELPIRFDASSREEAGPPSRNMSQEGIATRMALLPMEAISRARSLS